MLVKMNQYKQTESCCIRNVRLIDPLTERDLAADVLIGDGKIEKIAPHDSGVVLSFEGKTIDATGLWLIPGLVDLSARLREPGFEYKATLESELNAALAGGVTHLICPPDTDPVLDEPALVKMLKQRAQQIGGSYVYPLGALTTDLKGEFIAELAELAEAGCVAFSQADAPLYDTQVLLRGLQYAHTFGLPVWIRPQDPYLAKGGVAHSGSVAGRLGLAGLPVSAETVALHTLFELMRQIADEKGNTVQVHLCRLSSAAGIELVRKAKAEGLPVSCDVGVHHLHLTDMDIGFFDANAKLMPPLREQRDKQAILQGLLDGTIDAVCSDHTPVDDDEKKLPFGLATNGATGLELLLPLVVKLAQEQRVPLTKALGWITYQPAKVARISAGVLAEGQPAHLLLVSPQPWVVSENSLVSQGKHTPFMGYELPVKVNQTFVNGRSLLTRI
jgi:dihydroorotase